MIQLSKGHGSYIRIRIRSGWYPALARCVQLQSTVSKTCMMSVIYQLLAQDQVSDRCVLWPPGWSVLSKSMTYFMHAGSAC